MKELRIYPPPAGQTDLFSDPAFMGTGCLVTPATAVDRSFDARREVTPGHAANTQTGAPCKGGRAAGRENRLPKIEISKPASGQPVTARRRMKNSRRDRTLLSARQAARRASKSKNGMCRIETWVPLAVREACRRVAKSRSLSVDQCARGIIEDALRVGAPNGKGARP